MRFLGLLLIPLLAVSFVGLFGSSYASAQTPYDDVVTVTDTLYHGNTSNDVSLNYWSLFEDACSDPGNAYIQVNGQSPCDDYQDAVYSPNGRWFIVNYNEGSGRRGIGIIYTHDYTSASPVEFHTYTAGSSTFRALGVSAAGSGNGFIDGDYGWYSMTLRFHGYFSLGTYSNNLGQIRSPNPTAFPDTEIFIANYDIEYPPGYQGVEAPGTIVDPSPSATPEATLEVSTEGNLMVLPKTWLTMPIFATSGGELGANIEYILYGEDNTVLSSDVFTTTKRPFTYHLPGIGDYVMRVQYVHPGIPYAPWDPPPELGTLRFEFTYNGQYILIDGEGDHCSLDGDVLNCEGGTTYVDCSYHLADFSIGSVSDYVDCVIYNQQTWFKSLLTGFFVPSYTFYDSWFDDFDRFFAHQFGGVYQSTTMGASLLIDVVDAGRTTRCVLSPDGTFFGSDFSVDFCVLDDVWPVGVTAMRVIVIGVTSVALLFALLRKFNEVARAR